VPETQRFQGAESAPTLPSPARAGEGIGRRSWRPPQNPFIMTQSLSSFDMPDFDLRAIVYGAITE